ncbi:chaperone DnaJ-domain superfamily protein [Tasmannia lanceolata]|uniref:chaperone DnaJ-domain superfamily protein n=1 Tax=Tasmannia lanceolata TaxID=3420 RepID=UPI0040638719
MALSSPPPLCIFRSDPIGFPSPTPKHGDFRPFPVRFPSIGRRSPLRSSADVSSSETSVESPSETPVETSKGFSSLISPSNVEKALRGIAITSVDHYAILGITKGTSYDQVTAAYKRKCEELMNQGLDEEENNKAMALLKESHAILSSEEERRLYDWSLSRIERPDRYVWPFEVDITQTPTQPAPPPEPEDVGPTRLVGYFFLAWLILSFALSATLNR